MKVVLVDDNPLFNFISVKTIMREGFSTDIREFISCTKALKFLRGAASTPELLPDIIFLDVKMQVMDGFGFLDEFMKLPDIVKSRVRISMLTSSLLESDRQRAMSYSNVVEFLNKPLTREKLLYIKDKISSQKN